MTRGTKEATRTTATTTRVASVTSLAEQLALLGTMPDENLATWRIAMQGTATDGEVARQLGRPRLSVGQKRRQLGIPNRFDGRMCFQRLDLPG